jgi:TetR/AcrR family transcriptional repressor of mexJK operon
MQSPFCQTPPCPSRREARRQSRRDAILKVAARSFLEHGYAATTMSGIAAELGGSKGTLWSYFPAKGLLFAAMLDRVTETFQQHLSLILNPEDDLAAALRGFARELIQKVTSPEAVALYRLVMGEANRFPEIGRIFHERALGRTRGLLAAYLGDMMTRGQLRTDDPHVAAQQLAGLCQSGCHQLLILGIIECADPARIETDVANSVGMFMRAYTPNA